MYGNVKKYHKSVHRQQQKLMRKRRYKIISFLRHITVLAAVKRLISTDNSSQSSVTAVSKKTIYTQLYKLTNRIQRVQLCWPHPLFNNMFYILRFFFKFKNVIFNVFFWMACQKHQKKISSIIPTRTTAICTFSCFTSYRFDKLGLSVLYSTS